jgi:hypothetical protein
MVSHPQLEPAPESGMPMFIGTFPQVLAHIQIVKESLSTRKSQHRVVRKTSPAAEHFHLAIVFHPMRSSFVCTTGNIADSRTHQIVLHFQK